MWAVEGIAFRIIRTLVIKIQFWAAVGTEQKTGILACFTSACRSAFTLTQLLHGFPSLHINYRFVRMFKTDMLGRITLNLTLVLIRRHGKPTVYGVADIILSRKDIRNRPCVPVIRSVGIKRRNRCSGFAVFIHYGCQYLHFFQPVCDHRRTESRNAHGKNFLNHRRRFLIHKNMIFIVRVFNITVRRSWADAFTLFRLCSFYGTDLFACIPRKPFVE